MNRSTCKVAVPAAVVVMVAFLSAIFFAGPSSAYAAASKKKASAVSKSSAVEHTEARIKQLEDALKVTEAQKELWNNVTLVMRENAKDMDSMRKERSAATATMNAVDRLKFHSEISEIQLEQLEKLIPPFEALYASMSVEQKASTDAIMQTGTHRKHKSK